MEEIKNVAYSQAIYKALPVPIIIFESDVRGFAIKLINNAAERLLNIAEQENIGRNFLDFIVAISENQQLDWKQCLHQVCERKENRTTHSFKCVFTPETASPYRKFFNIIFTPFTDNQDVLLNIIATVTDVTEETVATKQNSILNELLLKKEKFLHETQRVARNGTWEIDLSTNSIQWSDMMREIYEVAPDTELDFETALAFFDEIDREKLKVAVEEAIEKGGMFDIELPITTSKGNRLWIQSTGKADIVDNVCTRLYGTVQDITEKKKTETALTESRNKHQSLIQSIDGIVWEADAQTFEFTFVSDKAQTILGYASEEWLKDPDFWSKHIYPEDRDYAVHFCAMQTKKARNHAFDYRMIKADGSIIWIKDIVSVIMENDKPSLLRGVMVDITETKLLNDLDHLEKRIFELNTRKEVEIETVLREYILGLEQIFPSMKCTVLRVKDNKLYHWAAPSLPKSYIDAINNFEIGPDACSCGSAAYFKKRVITGDIETDPQWANYKHVALLHNLRSCWSYPVIDAGGNVMAVWGLYYSSVKTPGVGETNIIERSVSILNVILENRLNAARIQEYNLLITQGQELANFGTWQWDINENAVTWSDILYEIFGLNKMAFRLTFEGYLAMLHPADQERVKGIIKNVLETHNDSLFEERIIRPDGEERMLKSWGRLILNEEGIPQKMVGACLDITQAKATQIQLREIAWLQSHVIRAPLARLIGLVDLLQNELPPHATPADLLNHIVNAAHELDDVIKSICNKTILQ
jgi:PAS domain S-box-containing protein